MGDYEGSKSLFNAGAAQAERIDSLQRALNAGRFNPLAQNPEVSRWNFEIMQSSLDGLFAECYAKLSSDSQKEGVKIKKLVNEFLEFNPIISKPKDDIKVNRENFKKFMNLLDIYERKIKVYLDVTNLNSPSAEDDDGL